ncbi:MAG: hypothetical protein FK733_04875, partial [Asgard group archaeon]|nr:hypothetical protein [Asgard group archaeon]
MKKRNKIVIFFIINLIIFSTIAPHISNALPGMTVQGYIYEYGTTTTIGDAKVTLVIDGIENGHVYSDEDTGWYSIQLQDSLIFEPIQGQLRVEKSGYYTITVNTIIPAFGQPATNEDVYLEIIPPLYTVSGYVKNYDGIRMSDAIVTLSGCGESDQDITDENGNYLVQLELDTYGYKTLSLTATKHPSPMEFYEEYSIS